MMNHEKREKVQRLEVAYKSINQLLESQLMSRDFHLGSDIAMKWLFVTAAYSGLEQVIKYLVAEERSCTIRELLKMEAESGNYNTGRRPFQTHNLATLFSSLEDKTKSIVRDYFSQYQSLHWYITIETVDDFLSEVSGVDGRGYELWRYSLIEDDERLPRNSAEAMLAIWGICVEIARSRLSGSQGVRMLDEELSRILSDKLCFSFKEQFIEIQRNSQSVDQRLLDLGREAYDGIFKGKHPLDVFAEILQHFGTNKSHGLSGLPDYVSKAVYVWIESISNFSEKPGISSLRIFIERAQGRTPTGESIRWNTDSRRFENVPWSLGLIMEKSLPPNAIEIEHPNCLQNLKIYAKESGYAIRENRSFTSPPHSDKDVFFCTLEVSESRTMEPVVTVWQKPGHYSDFLFIVEQKPNKIEKPVQKWIKINQILSNIGEFEEKL